MVTAKISSSEITYASADQAVGQGRAATGLYETHQPLRELLEALRKLMNRWSFYEIIRRLGIRVLARAPICSPGRRMNFDKRSFGLALLWLAILALAIVRLYGVVHH
jgi:hypothetical protein